MRDSNKLKNLQKQRRAGRVRFKIEGTIERPRLSVYRSLSHIYAQLIDDLNSVTLVAASDTELKAKATKTEKAAAVGELIAKKAIEKGISQVTFDRGGSKYHGRVKALADGARKGGLKF